MINSCYKLTYVNYSVKYTNGITRNKKEKSEF